MTTITQAIIDQSMNARVASGRDPIELGWDVACAVTDLLNCDTTFEGR